MTDAPETPLWEELKAILRVAAQLFGEPARLLEDLVLPRREASRLRAWLAGLEALARALLLVMAAGLPKPTVPFARRLARRLSATPALVPRVLWRPRGEACRPPPWDELVTDALSRAGPAARVFAPGTG